MTLKSINPATGQLINSYEELTASQLKERIKKRTRSSRIGNTVHLLTAPGC